MLITQEIGYKITTHEPVKKESGALDYQALQFQKDAKNGEEEVKVEQTTAKPSARIIDDLTEFEIQPEEE